MPLMQRFPDGSYRASNAIVAADVTLGADASLWFNTIVRGDVAPITIGQRVNVQDGSIIHCDLGFPIAIEEDVSVGHCAVIHGEFVGRGSLIGIGARLLGHSRIGAECLVAAGAVVPPGMQVPDRMMVMGIPAKLVRPVTEEELKYFRRVTQTYLELARKYAAGEYSG